jgi:hypothetical protein
MISGSSVTLVFEGRNAVLEIARVEENSASPLLSRSGVNLLFARLSDTNAEIELLYHGSRSRCSGSEST